MSAGIATLDAKERALHDLLADFGSVVVAFSGGVDSAFLACAAYRVLGSRALAVTALSPSYSAHQHQLALTVVRQVGLPHEFIHTYEMARPEYRANPTNRCYFCKYELYQQLTALARARGYRVVADGTNADDRQDVRPGRLAAREFGVRSPLDEVGLTKEEIRTLARRAGLATWDEPASACLASRIPYYKEVTDEKLRTIERAEDALRHLGFRVFRVRHHDQVARLEIAPDEMARAVEPRVARAIVEALRAVGYLYVTLDLQGYRPGSLNDAVRATSVEDLS